MVSFRMRSLSISTRAQRWLLTATACFGCLAFAQPSAAALIKVKAGHMVALDMAPLFVAKESGCFAKYGLDVQLVFFPNPGDQNAALAGGSLDFSTIPFTLAYLAQNNGVPIRVVSAAGGWGVEEVIAQKSTGLKSISDIKAYIASGKPPLRIAVLQGDTLEMIVRSAFVKDGIDPTKVKFVYFNDLLAMVDAFKDGDVDILSHIKPYTTNMVVNDGATVLTTSSGTWSEYTPNTVVGVLQKTLAGRPEVVKDYLEGLVCGANIINQTPQKAVDLLSKGSYYRVPPAVLLQAFTSAPAPISFIPDTTSIQVVVDEMAKMGYINAQPDAQSIFSLDIIKTIQANDLTK